jgi:hypothetical protein
MISYNFVHLPPAGTFSSLASPKPVWPSLRLLSFVHARVNSEHIGILIDPGYGGPKNLFLAVVDDPATYSGR